MHIIFLMYGSPGKHEMLKDHINEMRYTYEGVRKGYCRPFLSKGWGWYDVRIKKELAGQFIKDMNMVTMLGDDISKNGWWQKRIVKYACKLLRLICRFTVPKIPTKKAYTKEIPGWYYIFFVGCKADPVHNGVEVL